MDHTGLVDHIDFYNKWITGIVDRKKKSDCWPTGLVDNRNINGCWTAQNRGPHAGTISYHLWQVIIFSTGWYDYVPIVAGIGI